MNDIVDIESNVEGSGLARIIRLGMVVFIVLIIVLMFPVSARPAIDIKIAAYQAAAVVFGGMWLIAVATGRVPLKWPRIFGPILVLMLASHGIAVLFSNNPALGVLAWSRTFCLVTLFVVASQVYTSARQARSLLVAVCIGVALSTFYAFAQKTGIDPFPWEESQRDTSTYLEMPGTFGNPNIAGHALILAIILATYLATMRSTRWCALFVPLFASHLYLTHFRAGLLALAAGIAVAAFAALLIRLRRTPAWTARATVVTSLAAAAVAVASLIGFAYTATANHRIIDDSMLLRYNGYFGAARMIAENPVVGFGPGMYAVENPPHWTAFEQDWLAEKHLLNEHVHSDVLEAWVETGVAGALAYVLFLMVSVYSAVRLAAQSEGETRRFALGLTALFIAFAVDGLFGFNSRVPVTAVLLFLLAGVLEGACRLPETAPPSRRNSAAKRFVALILAGVLGASSILGVRHFMANVSRQSAKNALTFRDVSGADRLSARAIRLAPYDSAAYITRAAVESRLGFQDRAAEQYEKALQIRPYDVPVLIGLARAHLSAAVDASRRSDRAATEESLKRVDETAGRVQVLCPRLPDANEILGRAALARAQLYGSENDRRFEEEAEAHFLKALGHGAANGGVLLWLASECRSIAGDDDGVQEYLDKALDLDPSMDQGWQAYLQFAARTDRFNAIEPALDRAIGKADRGDDHELRGSLHAWRAQTYARAGRPNGEVAAEYNEALVAAPNTAAIWESSAIAARGAEEEFIDVLRRVESALPHVAALKLAFNKSSREPVESAAALHQLAAQVMTPGYVGLRTVDIVWTLEYMQIALHDSATPDADQVEGLAHVAAAFEVLQRDQLAANVYQSIVEHASGATYVAAAIKGGALLIGLSKFEEAHALLEVAVKRHMNNVPLRLEYARALSGVGKSAAARMELNDLRTRFNLDANQRAAVDAELERLSR